MLILVAAPIVFWLFRSRGRRRGAGPVQNEWKKFGGTDARPQRELLRVEEIDTNQPPLADSTGTSRVQYERQPELEDQQPLVDSEDAPSIEPTAKGKAEPLVSNLDPGTGEDSAALAEVGWTNVPQTHDLGLKPTENVFPNSANGSTRNVEIGKTEVIGHAFPPNSASDRASSLSARGSHAGEHYEVESEKNIKESEQFDGVEAHDPLAQDADDRRHQDSSQSSLQIAELEDAPLTTYALAESGAFETARSHHADEMVEVPVGQAAGELNDCEPPAVAADETYEEVIASASSVQNAEVQHPPPEPGVVSGDDEPALLYNQGHELEDFEIIAPTRYTAPPQRQARPPSTRGGETLRRKRSCKALEIRVRLTLDRFDFCQVSFLPERKRDMEDEITVKVAGTRLILAAQEDWYGDLYFEDTGKVLTQGIRIAGLPSDGQRVEWQLSSGRNIYVLANNPSTRGFVSVPRLVLGRKHVVLCANGVLEEAEEILTRAGCKGYEQLDAAHGMPDGWTGLSGVSPKAALTLGRGTDPFYTLKPAPGIEIDLKGGLLLQDAAWLSGYPPEIRIGGQTDGEITVLIDGKEAQSTDGCYTLAGFDTPGQHLIECVGLSRSRSYSIEEPSGSWEPWAAYGFPGGDVCGPLVTLRPEK